MVSGNVLNGSEIEVTVLVLNYQNYHSKYLKIFLTVHKHDFFFKYKKKIQRAAAGRFIILLKNVYIEKIRLYRYTPKKTIILYTLLKIINNDVDIYNA